MLDAWDKSLSAFDYKGKSFPTESNVDGDGIVYYIMQNGEYKLDQPDIIFVSSRHVETVVLLSHKNADTHINVNVEFGEGAGKIPVGKIAEKAENYRPNETVTYKI
ncbi:hypothetical protein F3D3_3252 [Fusibacter sp. 3D3]|nr:hypothetical protein F3D3_3252 [Fusibacter sp. 3D3]